MLRLCPQVRKSLLFQAVKLDCFTPLLLIATVCPSWLIGGSFCSRQLPMGCSLQADIFCSSGCGLGGGGGLMLMVGQGVLLKQSCLLDCMALICDLQFDFFYSQRVLKYCCWLTQGEYSFFFSCLNKEDCTRQFSMLVFLALIYYLYKPYYAFILSLHPQAESINKCIIQNHALQSCRGRVIFWKLTGVQLAPSFCPLPLPSLTKVSTSLMPSLPATVWWLPMSRKVPTMLRQLIKQQFLCAVLPTLQQMTSAFSRQYQNFFLAKSLNCLHSWTNSSSVLLEAAPVCQWAAISFPLTLISQLSVKSMTTSPGPRLYLSSKGQTLMGLQLAPIFLAFPSPKRTRVLTWKSAAPLAQVVMARKVPTMLRQMARNWYVVFPWATQVRQRRSALVRQYQYLFLRALSTKLQMLYSVRWFAAGSLWNVVALQAASLLSLWAVPFQVPLWAAWLSSCFGGAAVVRAALRARPRRRERTRTDLVFISNVNQNEEGYCNKQESAGELLVFSEGINEKRRGERGKQAAASSWVYKELGPVCVQQISAEFDGSKNISKQQMKIWQNGFEIQIVSMLKE